MRQFTNCLVLTGLIVIRGGSQNITTVAGTGSHGYSGDNSLATAAQIDTAHGVAVDAQGNVFIADSRNHRVRKIANGIITSIAGNGQEGFSGDGGPGIAAQLSFPRGVAVDGQGNVYVSDTGNSRIRVVSPSGTITTIAGGPTAGFSGDGGPAANAQLSFPSGLAVDSGGNLYVADSWNFRVREINLDGKIQTVAGNGSCGPFGDGGPASAASLGLIQSLTVDTTGNLYLSDTYNHLVRKVVPGGAISTVVGGGFGPAADGGAAQTANLKFPQGITVDAQGNLFLADSLNHRIRKVSSDGVISTVAGTGTPGYSGDGRAATAAQLNRPVGLGVDARGALTVSDLGNYRVRSVPAPPAPIPVITAVSNAAGGQGVITPGAYISIYGTNLAAKTDNWNASIVNQHLPTQIDGVAVSVGGKAAYVYYISPGQVNIVAPDVNPGVVPVQVTNAGIVSAAFNATAQTYSPAFFLWGQYAVATHGDYSLCARTGLMPGVSATPAKPGEWITLWGNGFGPSGAPSGSLTPGDKSYVTAAVTVVVGGVNAPVYGGTAVLTPSYAGLYQVAIQIPASTPDGDAEVRATVGGVQSPGNVFITVQH
jgi:uncharacterized protein (TIGR03437 family)